MPTLDANNNIIVTPADVRTIAPEFKDTTAYPDADIQARIMVAGIYISKKLSGDIGFERRALLIELMAAHLLKLDELTGAAGGTSGGAATMAATGQRISATVGQVSVSYAVPSDNGAMAYFLNQTTYGQRYWALLRSLVTPIYYGGSPQRVL